MGDFKNCWANYCANNGNGKNDPTKHPKKFHIGFLDYIAKMANAQDMGGMGGGGWGGGGDWQGGGQSFGAAGGKGKKGGGGGPYGKGGSGKGGGGGGDDDDMSVLMKLLNHPGLQGMQQQW